VVEAERKESDEYEGCVDGDHPYWEVSKHRCYSLFVVVNQNYYAYDEGKSSMEGSVVKKTSEILVVTFAYAVAYPWAMVVYISINIEAGVPWTSMQALHREQWKALGGLTMLQVLQ